MKKRMVLLLVTIFLLLMPKALAKDVSGMINDKDVIFDQPPIIENGRTLVPLRAIFEELGAVVDWDDSTKTANAEKDGVHISIQINSNNMYKNGSPIALDVPAKIVNGRTLVPARAIAESFNCDVLWDGDNKIVSITTSLQENYDINEYADNYSKKLSVGLNFAALVKPDNSLWVWGKNEDPVLVPSKEESMIKTPSKIMEDVIAVSCGDEHILALKEDGTVWAWGKHEAGQVGNSTTDTVTEPQKILENIVSIAAGNKHSIALDKEGNVYAWGDNFHMQLGVEQDKEYHSPQKICENVEQIGAGNNYSIIVIENKAVILGVTNLFVNEHGRSLTGPSLILEELPIKTVSIKDILQIKTFYNGFFVKTTRGNNVYLYNSKDMLADLKKYQVQEISKNFYYVDKEGRLRGSKNAFTNLSTKLKKDYIIDGIDYMTESYGDFVVAICRDGSVWSWGKNPYGNLGTGSARVSGPTRIIEDLFDEDVFKDTAVMKNKPTTINFIDERYGPEDYVIKLSLSDEFGVVTPNGVISVNIEDRNSEKICNKDTYLYESSYEDGVCYIRFLTRELKNLSSSTGILRIRFIAPFCDIEKIVNVYELP